MFDIYQIMRSLPLLAAILFDRHLEKIYSFADSARVARLSAGVFWNSRAFSTMKVSWNVFSSTQIAHSMTLSGRRKNDGDFAQGRKILTRFLLRSALSKIFFCIF